MGDLGRAACVLLFATGCITPPPPQRPQASGDRVTFQASGRMPQYPRFTADCPAQTPDAPFRAGEVIVAYGYASDPMFRVEGLLVVVDGKVLFNHGSETPDHFVILREVAPDKAYTIQAVLRLEGAWELKGAKFMVPASHSFRADGPKATCLDVHVGFTDDRERLRRRPYVSFTEVPLAVPGN